MPMIIMGPSLTGSIVGSTRAQSMRRVSSTLGALMIAVKRRVLRRVSRHRSSGRSGVAVISAPKGRSAPPTAATIAAEQTLGAGLAPHRVLPGGVIQRESFRLHAASCRRPYVKE
jgi:hypothetical protein